MKWHYNPPEIAKKIFNSFQWNSKKQPDDLDNCNRIESN